MLNIDFWNIAFLIINIIILYLLMKKFLVKPVMGVIAKRQELIDGKMNEALMTQEEADSKKAEYEEKLVNAHSEAKEIIETARTQAQTEKKEILESARMESEQIKAKAKQEIQIEREKAQHEVEAEVTQLAMIAARKILKAGGVNDTDSNK